MAKKHYPVQRCLPLHTTSGTLKGIDTALALSMQNHRLYSQNRVYRVKLSLDPLKFPDPNGNFGQIQVYAISDTWINHQAHGEAMKQFQNAHLDEMRYIRSMGGKLPRWRDFRTTLAGVDMVYPYATQNSAGVLSNDDLLPSTGNADFEPSLVETTSGAQSFSWVGGVPNTFNIGVEFGQNLYNIDDTPETPLAYNPAYSSISDNSRELDGIDSSELDSVSTQGDEPPYDKSNIPPAFTLVGCIGSNDYDPDGVASATVGDLEVNTITRMSTGFFDAPCGLIMLYSPTGALSNEAYGELCLEVKGGDYKGVHAPQYTTLRLDKSTDTYEVV